MEEVPDDLPQPLQVHMALPQLTSLLLPATRSLFLARKGRGGQAANCDRMAWTLEATEVEKVRELLQLLSSSILPRRGLQSRILGAVYGGRTPGESIGHDWGARASVWTRLTGQGQGGRMWPKGSPSVPPADPVGPTRQAGEPSHWLSSREHWGELPEAGKGARGGEGEGDSPIHTLRPKV